MLFRRLFQRDTLPSPGNGPGSSGRTRGDGAAGAFFVDGGVGRTDDAIRVWSAP
jgi:hypothetical protein